MVDSKHITQHLDDEKPDDVENEAVEQIAFADRILLNKVDLATDSEIKEVVKRIKASTLAPIYQTENSIIDPSELIGIGSFDLEKTLEMDPEFLDTDAEHEHDQNVTSISSKVQGGIERE